MHLHGFYFEVDGLGDGLRDATIAPDDAAAESSRSSCRLAARWR